MMRGRSLEGEPQRIETSKDPHLHFPVAGSKFDSSPGHEGRVLFETQDYIISETHNTHHTRGIQAEGGGRECCLIVETGLQSPYNLNGI